MRMIDDKKTGGKAERLFVLGNGGFAEGFCLGPSAGAVPAHVNTNSFSPFSLDPFCFTFFSFACSFSPFSQVLEQFMST